MNKYVICYTGNSYSGRKDWEYALVDAPDAPTAQTKLIQSLDWWSGQSYQRIIAIEQITLVLEDTSHETNE